MMKTIAAMLLLWVGSLSAAWAADHSDNTASDKAITITDIAGRTVTLSRPAQKVVLGEGRFMAVLGVLGISNPVSRVAGMMNEFRVYDPNTFSIYARTFPGIEKIPTFGHTSEDSVSVEQLILLNPEAAIFGLDGHGPGARSHHITEKLRAAGIPVIFIDFRQAPIKNTAKSVEIVGQVLGQEEAGRTFADYYQHRLQAIAKGVANIAEGSRPRVLFDLRVDSAQPCCFTVAKGLFATMAGYAGAKNVAATVLDSRVGQLSREYVLTADIDVYIGTAFGDPAAADDAFQRIVAGPGTTPQQARASLRQTLDARGLTSLAAVKEGRAYALWHHFYNSPLNLYAIEKMATWFHPDIFAELNPEATLKRLLAGFAPLKLEGEYATALPAASHSTGNKQD